MLISFLFFDFLIFDVLGVKTFDVRATIMVRAWNTSFPLVNKNAYGKWDC